MSKIFISYRRADSAATCDRIYERLVAHFGRAAIFRDIYSIGLGNDFRQDIERVLQQCSVQLVLIGPQWVTITDDHGRRRLDDPADLVRQEVETALQRGIHVIPVLVQGAALPAPKDLPPSVRTLPNLNTAPVRYDPDFDADMQRLCQTLEQWIAPVRPSATQGQSGSAPGVPRTYIVNPLDPNGYLSIGAAVQAARDGDRIRIRPGRYTESVTIEKSVELVGDGTLGEVVLESSKGPVILFKADHGRIANLTLRQVAGGVLNLNANVTVDIAGGRLELEECDISCQNSSCVAIHDGAFPFVRRNRIHEAGQSSIVIYDNGQGVIEDNEICGSDFHGVSVRKCGDLTLRRNRIHDNKGTGIWVGAQLVGRATSPTVIEDNDIYGNSSYGLNIDMGSTPTVRRNRIHDCRNYGVFVCNSAQGTIEDNDIFGNARSGVNISRKANPIVRRNRIHDQYGAGVCIEDHGRGILEDNDIVANATVGVAVTTWSKAMVRGNRITKNGRQGVAFRDAGSGTFENNDLRGNSKGAWDFGVYFGLFVKRENNQE